MTFNDFRELNNKVESILQTYIGKNDREDLSTRIHIKLSPVYENILFEQNEKFRVDVKKINIGYEVYVEYVQRLAMMINHFECYHTLIVVDGKFTELTKEQSK